MDALELDIRDNIAWLTLSRPRARNALSPDLLEALIAACERLRTEPEVRVLVLRGAGGVFSAGADLMGFMARLHGSAEDVADLGRRASLALLQIPQISVAAIEGPCIGGGLVLAASCDLRWAAADAWFSIPELDLGIPLAWGGMERLVDLIGETRAVELVLSCRRFDAAEADRYGLLSAIVGGDFRAEIESRAARLAARPSGVLQTTKHQIQAIRDASFDARSDAQALLSALRDPDTIKVAQEYMARLRRRSPGS